MIKKIKLFDQLDDLYVEQEVLMKQSSAYKQKNNIKWVDLDKKRVKVWKKIDKLERLLANKGISNVNTSAKTMKIGIS